MLRGQLIIQIGRYAGGEIDINELLTAVDAYSSASDDGNANVIRSLPPIYKLFKDWCKETNRNGGVIISSSIREFCTWCDLKLNESCGGNAV